MILTLPSSPKFDFHTHLKDGALVTEFRGREVRPLFVKPKAPLNYLDSYLGSVSGKYVLYKHTKVVGVTVDFKAFYSEASEYLGYGFLKRLRAHSWETHFRSWHPELRRYLIKPLFNGGRGRRQWTCDVMTARTLLQNLPLLEQLEKDKLLHLTPVTVMLGMDTKEARNYFGKGLWKKIVTWSPYRLTQFGAALQPYVVGRKQHQYSWEPEKVLRALADAPAARLSQVRVYQSDDSTIWALKSAKNAHNVGLAQNLYGDTERMFSQLGKKVNPDWSFKRLKEEHDQAVLDINRRKYSNEPFCEKDVHDVGGYIFTRLNSPLEVRTEGDSMRHCVGSYATVCAQGTYRVYTVEKGNERATLGITRPNRFSLFDPSEGWSFQQCYGFANKSVSQELRDAAYKLVSKLNEGEKK